MKTLVQVTADDIRHGIPGSFFLCPVALALARVVEDSINLQVGGKFFGTRPYIPLPLEVYNFIQSFDRGEGVKPFEFEVDIPTKYLKEKYRHPKDMEKENNSDVSGSD